MDNVLLPPTYREIAGPLIFLAGPIQGAPDWQAEAIGHIRAASGIAIANPRRPEARPGEFTEDMYNEQVDWEHHHLQAAERGGVILFWLAKEAVHMCDRAYAQTSRFELGEAVTLHRVHGAKVAVGIEKGFSNTRYLLRTIAKKAPGIPLLSSLEETCRAAVALAVR